MKKIISILILSLGMSTILMAQQSKSSDCTGCGVGGSGIFAFKYITDNKLNYKITDCAPNSDIEVYSTSSGGTVVAYATADEKGEAVISLPEKVSVGFALNHSRMNGKGASGKGQVYSLDGRPVLDIESPALAADNAGSVTVDWKANAYGGHWDFAVQRSTNGINFTTVASIASDNGSSRNMYSIKSDMPETSTGIAYYRVVAINKQTGVEIHTAVKDVKLPALPLFTAINTNNRIRVHFSGQVTYPATYSFTEMQGIKVATGVLKSNDQVIDISSYQTKVYVLHIIDSKNNTGSQMLLKN